MKTMLALVLLAGLLAAGSAQETNSTSDAAPSKNITDNIRAHIAEVFKAQNITPQFSRLGDISIENVRTTIDSNGTSTTQYVVKDPSSGQIVMMGGTVVSPPSPDAPAPLGDPIPKLQSGF